MSTSLNELFIFSSQEVWMYSESLLSPVSSSFNIFRTMYFIQCVNVYLSWDINTRLIYWLITLAQNIHWHLDQLAHDIGTGYYSAHILSMYCLGDKDILKYRSSHHAQLHLNCADISGHVQCVLLSTEYYSTDTMTNE